MKVLAGFIAVLVGITSSVALVFQAATVAGASAAQAGSWIGALSIGMGVTSIALSLRHKIPILTAWSTPGAAILITSLSGISMSDAIGAFVISAVLIILSGVTGIFEKIMDKIPLAIARAMLAGVLLHFGSDVFFMMKTQFALCFGMLIAYLLAKRLVPKFAMIVVLISGICIAGVEGLLHFDNLQIAVTTPFWVTPTFGWTAIMGVSVPLFVVTMTSQNMPGVAILRSFKYHPPLSSTISWTGIANLVLAPFGGFALNLAAITAAICMGEDVDRDPSRRYSAAVWAGIFYCVVGIFGATVSSLLASFPKELILAVAGFALLGTIGSSLAAALHDDKSREPALLTFLVTASGVTFYGIGSAFWGLFAGLLATLALIRRKKA